MEDLLLISSSFSTNKAFTSLCRAPTCLWAPSGTRAASGLPGLLESEDRELLPPRPSSWALGPLGAPLPLRRAARGAPSESARARGCWLTASCPPAGPRLDSHPLRRPSVSSPAQEPTTHFMQVAAIPAGPGPSGACGGRPCARLLSARALPRGLQLPGSSLAGACRARPGLGGATSRASPSEPASWAPRTSSGKALRPGFWLLVGALAVRRRSRWLTEGLGWGRPAAGLSRDPGFAPRRNRPFRPRVCLTCKGKSLHSRQQALGARSCPAPPSPGT